MMNSAQLEMRAYFESLPVYSEQFDEIINQVVSKVGNTIKKNKGQIVDELSNSNKDFWFLKQGYLKEMYKNPFDKEDSLFSLIPPKSIFVNEDTLFNHQHPKHYFIAYSDVEFVRFRFSDYEAINKKTPLMNILYLAGTAEIQKNRRARLLMLRLRKTSDKIKWVREYRPDLFKVMDKVILAQYIGVSRAGLYRAL